MINRRVPNRAFLALLLSLALAAWPAAARAAAADQPEAGETDTDVAGDKPAAEGFAPDEQESAVPSAAAAQHTQAMCSRLDELMGKGLSYAERGKAAETRAALHCPPASHATQAAETAHTK